MRRAGSVFIAALAIGLGRLGRDDARRGLRGGRRRGCDGRLGACCRAAIEAAAARLAGGRPRRLPAARRAAADRAIERLWLEGEAAARGLEPLRGLTLLRGEVADALAGPRPRTGSAPLRAGVPGLPRALAVADALRAGVSRPVRGPLREPGRGRRGDLPVDGRGDAVRGRRRGRARWLVVRDAASARSRVVADAGSPARAPWRSRWRLYGPARGRVRRAAGARDGAESRARARRVHAGRAAAAARGGAARVSGRRDWATRACRSRPWPRRARRARARSRDSDPYMFGFGMQDVVGGAEGLIVARTALARGWPAPRATSSTRASCGRSSGPWPRETASSRASPRPRPPATMRPSPACSPAWTSAPSPSGRSPAASTSVTASRAPRARPGDDRHAGGMLVIAHRGASGYRPEHTLASYELAARQGADHIEPDLVITLDGVLVARHEPEISTTTDVAGRPEFAERTTTKDARRPGDHRVVHGGLHARRAQDAAREGAHPAAAAAEHAPTTGGSRSRRSRRCIELRERLSVELGRELGIYPETKHPTYFRARACRSRSRSCDALHAQRARSPRTRR